MVVAMSMIDPNVVHVSSVFLHESYVFPSLILCLGIHLILVMHFVWCGIEYSVMVLARYTNIFQSNRMQWLRLSCLM